MTIEFVETLPQKWAGKGWANLDPAVQDWVKALRANPGRWAKYPLKQTELQSRSMGTRISAQRRPATPLLFMPDDEGSFQATVRGHQLYARFVKHTGRQRKS